MNWLSDRIRLDEDILVLHGAYDALSAKLLSLTSCEAIYCGGFAATAAQFALPDLGLVTQTEMVQIYTRMAVACDGKPLIVDADAGHGGLLNIERTIGLLASAGVTALHIEDQVTPKRCGHLAGKDVVSRDEAVARVKTAVQCSESLGLDVIARTDAIAVHGFDEAISRANAFVKAGAAAVFVDAPKDLDQITAIPSLVDGPLVFNAALTGTAPVPDDTTLKAMGYAVVLHPLTTIIAAVEAIIRAFPPRASAQITEQGVSFARLNKILETAEYLDREKGWFQLAMAERP
ncbi:MAG: isocitrate lyase/PEP mutase family protein [Hyphomicrobiales bacterium]